MKKILRPYLKPILCRILSLSAMTRTELGNGEVVLGLRTLPESTVYLPENEEEIISRFLTKVGEKKPLLVGYNSYSADLKILFQRAVVKGITAPDFCDRPDKPWEGCDYFTKDSKHHIDLFYILGKGDKQAPSLHEVATLSGIPGKMEMDGNDVHEYILSGNLKKIIEYNEYDAITTYLLFLRMFFIAGCLDQNMYIQEQELVENFLIMESKKADKEYLQIYIEKWMKIRKW